ncbi:hypothetical protein [Pseudomonas fulva]|uniref:hypothetical protein n=1 Tax=Pseudomonas fulva TaxID=47880 RepID=UPI0018AC3BC1|nr:hypothetical protein [Pseudomonas fulva]MBF8677355.1 hypothetical protein [Pseudomonas fulva]MBF8716090.1 hypothetical protein [Pseudomonas fulva]MBF8782762.1 hypothetical protein [Pseudomonas fulva]
MTQNDLKDFLKQLAVTVVGGSILALFAQKCDPIKLEPQLEPRLMYVQQQEPATAGDRVIAAW